MSFHDTMRHSNPVLILGLTIRNSQAPPCISLHSAGGDSEADTKRNYIKEFVDRAGSLRACKVFILAHLFKAFPGTIEDGENL